MTLHPYPKPPMARTVYSVGEALALREAHRCNCRPVIIAFVAECMGYSLW